MDNALPTTIEIIYNKNTFCLQNPTTHLRVTKVPEEEIFKYIYISNKQNYKVDFTYKNINIILHIKNSIEILLLYVILQHHYMVNDIQCLVNAEEWDYMLWNINISSVVNGALPDHLILLNCFLNLKDNFNKPLDVLFIEEQYKLKIKDRRGLGGERPRELNYKFGFPYFTSSTKKYLNNGQRIFICPFPIESINPERKAIINSGEFIKCFTCGTKEGETNIFGQICNFEKGHLIPMKYKNTIHSSWQCKWCNTFYKDKIIWNNVTGKPEFNCYAVMRDTQKKNLICFIKQLGISADDLHP